MDTEKEIIENRTQNRITEAKLQALINILGREGILEEDELQDEFDRLIKNKEK